VKYGEEIEVLLRGRREIVARALKGAERQDLLPLQPLVEG